VAPHPRLWRARHSETHGADCESVPRPDRRAAAVGTLVAPCMLAMTDLPLAV